MRIDEPGQGRHALGIDGLTTSTRRRARGDGHDAAVAHNDRPAVDGRTAADDDAGVGDDEILRRCRRGAAECGDEDKADENETAASSVPPGSAGRITDVAATYINDRGVAESRYG
jgi:hypothetical protein